MARPSFLCGGSDLDARSLFGFGKGIPIEERAPEEVTHFRGSTNHSEERSKASNPAFDVTPHDLIQGIITEKGIVRKPFEHRLRRIKTE